MGRQYHFSSNTQGVPDPVRELLHKQEKSEGNDGFNQSLQSLGLKSHPKSGTQGTSGSTKSGQNLLLQFLHVCLLTHLQEPLLSVFSLFSHSFTDCPTYTLSNCGMCYLDGGRGRFFDSSRQFCSCKFLLS